MTSDQWLSTTIDGVRRRHLPAHLDARGSFSELWRSGWTDPLLAEPFVQANLSRSKAGVLRGMHFHLMQTDLWVVIEGRAVVGLTDLRSPIAGPGWRPQADVLDLEAGDALLIPPRIAHGFYAPHDLSLVYLVTREFDATDEHGFAWDDPMAGLPWPVTEPILSARDRANPPLREALTALLGQPQSSGA
jgi:dTDP-4-dehydrorhamnose 3,5-epimerase